MSTEMMRWRSGLFHRPQLALKFIHRHTLQGSRAGACHHEGNTIQFARSESTSATKIWTGPRAHQPHKFFFPVSFSYTLRCFCHLPLEQIGGGGRGGRGGA